MPGIGWKQGTELDWLQHLASFWADEFDWRSWEQRLNAFDHFRWQGIHFMYKRSAWGRGLPLILTHGWPGSFLDYMDVVPMLDEFDLIIPSLPGYGFSATTSSGRYQLSLCLATLAPAHVRTWIFPLWCGGL